MLQFLFTLLSRFGVLWCIKRQVKHHRGYSHSGLHARFQVKSQTHPRAHIFSVQFLTWLAMDSCPSCSDGIQQMGCINGRVQNKNGNTLHYSNYCVFTEQLASACALTHHYSVNMHNYNALDVYIFSHYVTLTVNLTRTQTMYLNYIVQKN